MSDRGGPKTMAFDLVLRGGRVIDPSQSIDRVTDVAFAGGRVAALGDGLADGRPLRRGCRGAHRHAGPHRPAHPCLLGRHLARRRSRDHSAAGRRAPPLVDTGSAGPGQLRRLPGACDRALAGAHPRLSQHLLRRHLRLLEARSWSARARTSASWSRSMPCGSRPPTAMRSSASRCGSARNASGQLRARAARHRPRRPPTRSACR